MVDSESYVLSNSVEGISMDSRGTIKVNTGAPIALTSLSVSVTSNGGSETHFSPSFSVEISIDCLLFVKFPYLKVKYVSYIGEKFPIVDT